VARFAVHAMRHASPRPGPRCWTRVLRSALTHQGHRQLAPAQRRLIPFSSASVPAAARPSPWTRRLRIFNDAHRTRDGDSFAAGGDSSRARTERHQQREAAIQPGSRPGAELALYIEKVGDRWLICELKYGAVRCSRLVFFCYQRGALRSPTAEQQAEWTRNPGGKAAHIQDETKFLVDLMERRKQPHAHDDQIAMEHFAMKYHTSSTYANSLGVCDRMAIKISRAMGDEKRTLVRAQARRNTELARTHARSLARSHDARAPPPPHPPPPHTHRGGGGVQGGHTASVH